MFLRTTFVVVIELNTFYFLILIIGIIYLNLFKKVEGKSDVRIFNINVICVEKM